MTAEADARLDSTSSTAVLPLAAGSARARLPDLLLVLVVTIAAVTVFSHSIDTTLDARDEGYLLSLAARVANGEVPHRDFVDAYGPGVHWLNGAVLWLFGPEILPVRRLILIAKVAAVLLVFGIARSVASRPLALAGAALAILAWGRSLSILNAPYASLYTVVLCEAALLLLLHGLRRRSRRLLFGAGLVVGAALFFKQSVALVFAYALALGAWLSAAFGRTEPPAHGSRALALFAASIWSLTALAVLVPGAAHMQIRDYALHFLPFHALLGCAVLSLLLRGDRLDGVGLLDAATVSAGWAVMALGLLLTYLGLGSLGPLWHDMFVLPRTVVAYYVPILMPSALALIPFLLLAVGAISTLLLLLADRRRQARRATLAVVVALAAILSLSVVVPALSALLRHPSGLRGFAAAGPSVVGFAAAALLAPSVLRPFDARDRAALRLGLPVFMAHAMLIYLVFPRAGTNVHLFELAMIPLLVLVLQLWLDRCLGTSVGRVRRALAVGLVLVLPAAWVVPEAKAMATDVDRTTVKLRGFRGLRLDAATIRRSRVVQTERLIEYLDAHHGPESPMLLLSSVQLVGFAARRPLLPARSQAELYWASIGLWPPGSFLGDLDPALVRTLVSRPGTIVVRDVGRGGRRLAAELPELHAFLESAYEVAASFGPFRVLEPRLAIGALTR